MGSRNYSRDDLVSLLGGSMSNLPSHLHEREDGIWFKPVDPQLWDLLGEPERSVLSGHPNDNPTTEPMLPLPFFSVEEFVAFERCGHLMDLRTIYLECEITEWETDDEGGRLPTKARWTGLNEAGEELAGKRRRCGELLRALLSPSSDDSSSSVMGRRGSESAEDRQRRRLDRLQELGGDRSPRGSGRWRASGMRGALAALAREEAKAGRPFSDEHDVRRDVDVEASRRLTARALRGS